MPSRPETAEDARCRGSWSSRARAADARSEHRPSLAARYEQSENARADHQMLAIRQARAKSANASATQTTCTGASARLPSGKWTFLAASGATAGLRIFTPPRSEGTPKAPRVPMPSYGLEFAAQLIR